MTEQTHLLITTTETDDAAAIVKGAQQLHDARFDPLSVITATEAQKDAVEKAGFSAIMAPQISNNDEFAQLSYVVQGINAEAHQPVPLIIVVPAAKLETLNPEDLRACRTIFWHDWVDVAVFGRPVFEEADKNNPSLIKIAASQNHKVLYLSRGAVPYGADVMVADSGIRAYRTQALRQLSETEPSPLERTEKIALLRGLEAGLGTYLSLMTSAK